MSAQNLKYNLPFKIIYNIDENFKNGILTPIRNEIMAIIAERNSLSVAEAIKVATVVSVATAFPIIISPTIFGVNIIL